MTPPPFTLVAGCGRSGTTLVRAMLDSHPDLTVTHEAQVLTALAGRRDRYETSGGLQTDAFVRDLMGNAHFRAVGFGEPQVREALAAAAPTTFADAMRAVFAGIAAAEGKSRYGDKTPGYVARIPALARLFPEARFVHVIRDGRDSSLSYLDRGYGPRDVAEAAIRWESRVRRGRADGARLGPERYIELRYEELIADPAAALAPVCEFLGLTFAPEMLRYHERADQLLAVTRDPERFAHLAAPPTGGLRDWRTQMDAADLALFEAIAGPTLRDLGYEVVNQRPPASLRAQAAWRRLAWQRRRLAARLGR